MAALFPQTRSHSLLRITEDLPRSLRLSSIVSLCNTQLELIHCVWGIAENLVFDITPGKKIWSGQIRTPRQCSTIHAACSAEKSIMHVQTAHVYETQWKRSHVFILTEHVDNNAVLSSVLFWIVSVLFLRFISPTNLEYTF